MCMSILLAQMSLHHLASWCPGLLKDGSGSHGTRVIEVCNPPGGCCEPQPGPGQEQQLFLIPAPAITSKKNGFFETEFL